MSRGFLIPGIKQDSDQDLVRVSPDALRQLTPKLDVLLPQCVPTPYAEAEVMATILEALPPVATAPFSDAQTNEFQRQSFQRWQMLLKAVVLGRAEVENVALQSRQADNFGRALSRSRDGKRYQGVLRTRGVAALNLAGRQSRAVGGTDERALVWAAPRLSDTDWGALSATIHGAEEQRALDVLHAWREMLRSLDLWGSEASAPPWMRGVERTLAAHTPQLRWAQLADDVRMVGPVRLEFPHKGGRTVLVDVFVPSLSVGWATQFQGAFRLVPLPAEGGVRLASDREIDAQREPRVGRFVQLASTARNSLPDAVTSALEGPADENDFLLAGMGAVTVIDPSVQGERWWLQDSEERPGYRATVYEPLLKATLRVHARVPTLTESHMDSCPALFPDALRLARPLMYAPPGMGGVEYVTLKEKYAARVQGWPLPIYGQQLRAKLTLPGARETWVMALEEVPSAACFLERLERGGQVLDVGEVRAFGALLWEFFCRDVDFKAGSFALVRTQFNPMGGDKLASQPRENISRIVFDDALLAAVGSDLSDNAVSAAPRYRAAVQKRRATAMRFLASWEALGDAAPAHLLGALAARAFVTWAFEGPIDAWGRVAAPSADGKTRTVQVTRALAVPALLDTYPRKVG